MPGRVGTDGVSGLPSPLLPSRGSPAQQGSGGDLKDPHVGPLQPLPALARVVSGSPGLLRAVRAAGAALAVLGGCGGWQRVTVAEGQ